MRIVVDGGGIGAGDRVAFAVAGLARRGHRVGWLGGVPSSIAGHGVAALGWRDLAAAHAEVVIGDGSPLRTAVVGWIAGAEAMVVTLGEGPKARWGPLQRLGWSTLSGVVLASEAQARTLVEGAQGIDRERVGLWPDGPPAADRDPAHPDVEVLERAGERALARHRARVPRAAVFVDRDGTLVVEKGYLADPDGVEVLPGAARALRTLIGAGYPVVMITNQSGIGRGYYTAERVHATMARLRERLRAEGVELTAIYLCPHRPDEDCPCRKPRPGLILRAADDLLLSLRDSVMIGDKRIDVATGHASGGLGVLVRTGYGREEEAAGMGEARAPDAVVDDLVAAADWVLDRHQASA